MNKALESNQFKPPRCRDLKFVMIYDNLRIFFKFVLTISLESYFYHEAHFYLKTKMK